MFTVAVLFQGSDSVIECSTVGTTVQVTVSYNDGRSNSRLTDVSYSISPNISMIELWQS